MDDKKKYFAFISYKREDEKWAVWLQDKLEHYKLPANLNGRTDLPKEIRPIFRDKSELAAGVLAKEIQSALEASKYMIVICSPRAAQSQWVCKEVQAFIDMGWTDRIIPFIVGGKAHSQKPEDECFPSALLSLPLGQELLGINIDEMGRDAAAVKVVAQMFGLKFDELWQRYERKRKKEKRIVYSAIMAFAMVSLCVAGWIWQQNVKLKEKDWKMMENQARFIAKTANDLVDEGDSYTAQRLLLEVMPEDANNPIDKPYTIETEESLRKATGHHTAILKGHFGRVTSASYSPDGRRIVSASGDKTVRIWDAETGAELKTLKGHTDMVYSASHSPDGKRIVSASSDETIRIWDAETGAELKTLKGHTGWVCSAVFSPDGRRIVSASVDGTVRIWGFPPLQDLIDQTRERFKDRPLMAEERRMYYLE